jgi:hypothetical protein
MMNQIVVEEQAEIGVQTFRLIEDLQTVGIK